MPVSVIEWIGDVNGHARLLDQTLLPGQVKYLDCRNIETMWEAIKALRIRGAPAIGIAAGMGLVIGIQKSQAADGPALLRDVERAAGYLAASRPTAVNLFWALDRMKRVAKEHAAQPPEQIKRRLLDEAQAILREDQDTCRRIGEHGAALLRDGDTILTHCNAGALATGGCGTALAVVYAAAGQGKRVRVFADETRPLLQGARLTAWELMQAGIDVTLICDNMAAVVMKQKKINGVIVGADRIAANGDAANKIGTYGVAVLAKEHGVPFYVAAPLSTFDLSLESGDGIPIEERGSEEIACFGGVRTAPENVKVYAPAFDVTPARYIAAIITERGIIQRPDTAAVARHCR